MKSKKSILNEFLKDIKHIKIKYNKPFIITFSGYSGSGKSTIARLFAKKLDGYIVGSDRIRNYLYFNYCNNHDKNKDFLFLIIKKRIKEAINKGVPIIVDKSVSTIDELENLKKFYVDIIFIKLLSNNEENIKRILGKSKDKNITNNFGDYDDYSLVTTEEQYHLIKSRKVYNIPDYMFDYKINTLKGIRYV